ncbi:CD1871A family CXXC motif-containing protein [Butyrivibrio sp. YAB3001]|uniref:CD1871A family CXXC motif-containing protein n=1 Tax=Butyrivibrio sp. YAB3001 TaxID=1520812 RepID=UPI0008F6735E|nr:CD1871A family CXXC motif-containing protein [Butyrivibrio sp. YAB3001]SFB99930.1 hypothetical protein SAMN02910398_01272 [Butyrivibrio sp. YAB3001]
MTKEKSVPVWITYILLIAAIVSCLFGAYRGEIKTVYIKATNICMECIGIG